MKRFENILVVLDRKTDSGALIERAVTLSQRNQARLTVVVVAEELPQDLPTQVAVPPTGVEAPAIDIIEEFPPYISAPDNSYLAHGLKPIIDTEEALPQAGNMNAPSKSPLVIHEQIVEDISRYLEQIAASIQQAGVQVNTKVLHGTPFHTIIREVLRNDHDLVMITTEGNSGLKETLFASTTMHLMRKCPCPVWVIKPTQPKRYACILAAVDPTPSDHERNALNFKIMDLATSLAQLEHNELLVTHTWISFFETLSRSGCAKIPLHLVDEWNRETRNIHRHWLHELLQQYDLRNIKFQVFMFKGEAGRLIPVLAKLKDVELIVMGTVSRTGLPGLLISNTAENVLRQVDCSVLTVKPDGFITPVKLDR